ncbi:MAG: hypothetical protein R2734_20340 [Nocardioides sp.]
MTERLATLLQEQVDGLAVPPVPSAAVLAAGKRQRARRSWAVAVSSAAVAAAAVVAVVALRPDGGRTAPDPAPAPAPASYVAFGAGSTIYVGATQATVPDTVHSLHYTSVGVLVRSNPAEGSSDGSGPEALTLVHEDGSTVDLGSIPQGVGPATDPTQPYYVLAEAAGSGFEAAVRDAETGAEVARVPLPDRAPSSWDVPPLSLSGDTLYVGYRASTMAVDWRTGQAQEALGLGGGLPEVHGGLVERVTEDTLAIVDASSGAPVLTVPMVTPGATISLSPNGRFALVADHTGTGRRATAVVTVHPTAGGASVTLTGQEESRGAGRWTTARSGSS